MFARWGCGLGIKNVANPSENAILQAKTMYELFLWLGLYVQAKHQSKYSLILKPVSSLTPDWEIYGLQGLNLLIFLRL